MSLVAAPFAVGAFLGLLLRNAQRCECHLSGGEPSAGILELLGRQLDRCGPAALVREAPPPCVCKCPEVPSGPGPFFWVLLVAVGAAAFAAGAWWARRQHPAGPARVRTLSDSSAELADAPAGSEVVPATPSQLRRRTLSYLDGARRGLDTGRA